MPIREDNNKYMKINKYLIGFSYLYIFRVDASVLLGAYIKIWALVLSVLLGACKGALLQLSRLWYLYYNILEEDELTLFFKGLRQETAQRRDRALKVKLYQLFQAESATLRWKTIDSTSESTLRYISGLQRCFRYQPLVNY
jgi:low affinity Fe/Cu permease